MRHFPREHHAWSELKRIVGWGDRGNYHSSSNPLTGTGWYLRDHHTHIPEPGPTVDHLLTWLRERWTVDIDTRGTPHSPYQITAKDITEPYGVDYTSPWCDTLIEALAVTVLFLGTEQERPVAAS